MRGTSSIPSTRLQFRLLGFGNRKFGLDTKKVWFRYSIELDRDLVGYSVWDMVWDLVWDLVWD